MMERFQKLAAPGLRWFLSIAFFYLALSKGGLLIRYGLAPYEIFIEALDLPRIFRTYGFIAIIIEAAFAVGVWENKTYKPVVVLAGLLTLLGIAASLALIIFKIKSDCGCGLLGGNEYGLLFQKMTILALLLVLYRSKEVLFPDNEISQSS